MTILALLIPVSLGLGLLGLLAFLWTLRSGQYDDLEGAAHRVLLDDDGEPRAEPDTGPDTGPEPADSRD
ncbi:cbb3-type cytochrome oxidase assembly protein CcoS [Rhodobacterales bacterium HKCCE2091]|nr:cbb3-type cytochrome oxidase assembly protein CcoS [Rhodobacterales bacterium HKCCE2091]